MKTTIGAIILAALTLTTTTAFAENAVVEQRAELAKLWGQEQVTDHQAAAGSGTVAERIFTAISSGRADTVDAEAAASRGAVPHAFQPYGARNRR